MPRPPFTKFPKDAPLPISQRGELTRAFNNRANARTTSTVVNNIVEQIISGGSGGGNGGSGGGTGGGGGGVITALAGDVTGSPTANTIAAIQGKAIAPVALQEGQTYVLVSGLLTASSLAGDVSGSLVASTVTAIQGAPVAAIAPADQQELVYNAAARAYVPGVNPGAALHLWAECS